MGYSRLTPAQEEQMKKMHAEKKSAKEIIDFFKETYEIKMAPWKVSYICGKKGTGGGVATEQARKNEEQTKRRKLSTKKVSSPVQPPVTCQFERICVFAEAATCKPEICKFITKG